ncbi:MAG: site-specific DNA-methyltransferase [Selenomonadaceae bacterium]|nr:site-specific DNA-methyltransferase [Selenomonadaceae bacterium]
MEKEFAIYNGDCLELLKELPDGSVDMILDDLPYGTTDCAFDRRLPFEPMWEEFLRVTKHNAAIVLFSQMPFGAELIMSQRKLFRYEWIWEKSLGVGFLNAKKMPLRCHENILVFYRQLPTYNPQFTKGKPYKCAPRTFSANYANQRPTIQESDGRRYPRDCIFYDTVQDLHPQQKPTDLLEYLIRTYTNEGELVLDATMGSGSTGVACMNTKRRFVGIELEKKYYDIAQERIEKALALKRQELF